MKLTKPNNYKLLNRSEPIAILGNGSFGRDLYTVLAQQGFIVDAVLTSNTIGNYTNKNVQLLVGILNRNTPYSKLIADANSSGFKNLFLPWDYYPKFKSQLGWRYWLSDTDVILKNLSKLTEVYNLLADEHSKKLLQDIIEFRMGLNNDYSHYSDIEPQYFNYLTLSSDINNYIDGGAYNGDTYNQLKSICKVQNAILFEPDIDNYSKLKTLTKDAICLPLAISDKSELLSFDFGKGESSNLTQQGINKVMAVSLDDIVGNTKIDLIKLDLEGGELAAINGAINTIQKSRPRLAISLYHKPEDIWELPLLLNSICSDYKFFIRQHYYNSFDSVLYAISK